MTRKYPKRWRSHLPTRKEMEKAVQGLNILPHDVFVVCARSYFRDTKREIVWRKKRA